MREPGEILGVAPVSLEHFGDLSRRIEKLSTLLESNATSRLNESKADPAQPSNAEWLKEVDDRIRERDVSVRQNQKHAMIWGGIALMLAAIGSALLVNRLFPDPTGNDNVNRGVTYLMTDTLIWLTVFAAASLLAAAFLVKREERPSTSSPSRRVTLLQIIAVVVAAYGGFLWVSSAQGSGPSGAFRIGHGALGAGFMATVAWVVHYLAVLQPQGAPL